MRRISSIDPAPRRVASADSGFTLIELIAVMVLVGVLGAVVAMFGSPIRAGIDGQRRAELADAADTAYRRIARDIRRAVPNSIRLVGGRIEFISSKDGGSYAYDLAGDTGSNSISFDNAIDVDFDALGPPMYSPINAGDYIVIGNWGPGQTPNAYGPGCNLAEVQSVSGATVTLGTNSFANTGAGCGPSISPPGQRFQVVDKDEQAVTYACSGGELKRYWKYGFAGAHTGGSSAILAKNVSACDFQYSPFHSQMWGLFRMEITLQHADLAGDTPVKLVYQLYVNNTP